MRDIKRKYAMVHWWSIVWRGLRGVYRGLTANLACYSLQDFLYKDAHPHGEIHLTVRMGINDWMEQNLTKCPELIL